MPHDVTSWLFAGAAVSFAVVVVKTAVKAHAFEFTAFGLCLVALGLLLIGK
jgi:hypothetical protein